MLCKHLSRCSCVLELRFESHGPVNTDLCESDILRCVLDSRFDLRVGAYGTQSRMFAAFWVCVSAPFQKEGGRHFVDSIIPPRIVLSMLINIKHLLCFGCVPVAFWLRSEA